MLVRDLKRVFIFLLPSVVLLYLGLSLYHGSFAPTELIDQALSKLPSTASGSKTAPAPKEGGEDGQARYHVAPPSPHTHNEISSLSTPDRAYFLVSFGPGQEGAINPNIIPHPTDDGVYAIVAQEVARGGFDFHEIACYASFAAPPPGSSNNNNSQLSCREAPRNLPIEPTKGQACTGQYELLEANVGPHDARVFWGPEGVYAVYGSNSRFGCFGQFIQNFAVLMDWTAEMAGGDETFRAGTEIERPGVRGEIEKNWFVFWDRQGQIYAHYDVRPRSFARLEGNGSVGPDLAAAAGESREADEVCLARLLPDVEGEGESIHQATNSLAVTLCNRRDPECVAGRENTVLFTIFHHKTFRNMHSVYEPYVMAFGQEAPFAVYGVGRKPLWIRGRGVRDDGTTEMMFVTSISWKSREQRYHGYLDDEMFLGFGIEDKGTGGLDVRAEDVLRDLRLCEI